MDMFRFLIAKAAAAAAAAAAEVEEALFAIDN